MFEVLPLQNVGVEIKGLDVGKPVDSDTAARLRQVWLEHGIVLFRGLGVSPQALLNLSHCFGELQPHPIEAFRHPDFNELIVLSNKSKVNGPVYEFDGVAITGRIPWHTDLAFTTTPNAGAILRMVQKSDTGGQTGWIDTAMAYDALDEAMKQRIENLEAVYGFCADIGQMRFNNPGGKRLSAATTDFGQYPLVINPLVWVHPENGRKVINVSTLNIESIVGLPQEEGDALIRALIAHVLQPRFQYMHEWRNDDMMLWDNRRTQHCAMGHPVEETRIVHRTTIRGTAPMGRKAEETAA